MASKEQENKIVLNDDKLYLSDLTISDSDVVTFFQNLSESAGFGGKTIAVAKNWNHGNQINWHV